MHQCIPQPHPNNLPIFLPSPLQDNHFFMPPATFLPPLKVKQPGMAPTLPTLAQFSTAIPVINAQPIQPAPLNLAIFHPIDKNIHIEQKKNDSSSGISDEDSDDDSSDELIKGKHTEDGASSGRKDLKERNRLAAQKWRKKKDQYLYELESANDNLRSQALALCSQVQSLRVENKLLEDELQFFQSFMSNIMHVMPKD